MKSLIYAVDPGVKGTGVAVFLGTKLQKTFVIKPGRVDSRLAWIKRCEAVINKFQEAVSNDARGNTFVVEYPSYYQTYAGMTVAARGDLCKLAFITGAISGRIFMMNGVLKLCHPSEWKGNLPKPVAHDMTTSLLDSSEVGVLKACFGSKKKVSEHAMDAVGIGLWYVGRFK